MLNVNMGSVKNSATQQRNTCVHALNYTTDLLLSDHTIKNIAERLVALQLELHLPPPLLAEVMW